jgi:hypothetical protein
MSLFMDYALCRQLRLPAGPEQELQRARQRLAFPPSAATCPARKPLALACGGEAKPAVTGLLLECLVVHASSFLLLSS